MHALQFQYFCILLHALCYSMLLLWPGDVMVVTTWFDGNSRTSVVLLRKQFFPVVRKLIGGCSSIGWWCNISLVQRRVCGDVNNRCLRLRMSAYQKNTTLRWLLNDTSQCSASAGAEQHYWLYSNNWSPCYPWYIYLCKWLLICDQYSEMK